MSGPMAESAQSLGEEIPLEEKGYGDTIAETVDRLDDEYEDTPRETKKERWWKPSFQKLELDRFVTSNLLPPAGLFAWRYACGLVCV